MKAKINKWTMEDGVVVVNQIVSEHPSVRVARAVEKELTANDPECEEERSRLTSARWSQYQVIDERGGKH
jgi:hypothetical protein